MDKQRFLRYRAAAAAVGLTMTLFVGCSMEEGARDKAQPEPSPSSAKIQPNNVEISGFKFQTEVLTVPSGTTVSWVNRDPYFHTVTSGKTDGPVNEPDGRFDEDLKNEGDVINVTFSTPGVYTYYCKQHNAMNAEIRVS